MTSGLDSIFNSHFHLGMGVSRPVRIEDFHGVPYERPLRRQHEYIDNVWALVRGKTVD